MLSSPYQPRGLTLLLLYLYHKAQVKSFLHVFINCLIVNPSFTSQSKV